MNMIHTDFYYYFKFLNGFMTKGAFSDVGTNFEGDAFNMYKLYMSGSFIVNEIKDLA